MAKTQKFKDLPLIADLTGVNVVGLTAAGQDIRVPLAGIVRNSLGDFKTTDTAPVGPLLNQTVNLIGTGDGSKPQGTYTNLLKAAATPIVIPVPAAGNGIFEAKARWTGSFWVPSWWEGPLPAASNKIAPWAPQPYSVNDQVSNLGKFWYANAATTAADIPGTSTKWSSLLTQYDAKLDSSSLGTETVYTDNLVDKSTYQDNTTIRTDTGGLLGAAGARVYTFPVNPAKGFISISGIYASGSKAYRFIDSLNNVLGYAGIGNTQNQVLNIVIPANAFAGQVVGKSETNPVTAADALMVNYGATAKPWVPFSYTYVNSVNSTPINPKPKPVSADSDQATAIPFLTLGADGFIRTVPGFTYNPASGAMLSVGLNVNSQNLTGLKTAVNDSDAVPLSQVNSALSPINQATGNQILIPIPDLMTDPDVPVIETISTASAFSTASTVGWNTGIISILGGALTQASTGYPQSGYGVPRYATGANLNPPVTIEFTFTGSTFEFLTMGQGQVFRLLVDGKFVSRSFTSIAANGNIYFQKITFATSKKRRITIEGALGFFFGGIRYPTGSSVTPSDRTAILDNVTIGTAVHYFSRMPGMLLVFVLSDSFGEPTGTTGQQGYAFIMGKMLAWNLVASGAGGTGYVNPGPAGRVKFGDRFANDIAAFKPDIIVLAGGINDGAQPTATFTVAVKALFDQAKAVTSAKEVIVMSSWRNKGPQYTPAQQITNDAVLKAKAAEYGFIFIDESGLITGNGNSGAPNGSGNADQYVGGDGTHYNDAGHTMLGLNSAQTYIRQKNKFISSGTPARRMIDTVDADTTGVANSDGQNLSQITANRVYTPPAITDGKSFKIINYNTAAGFAWTFAAGTVKDVAGNAVTAIPNGSIINLFGSLKANTWIKE
ncbi:GDSL-like Lipase/Acylhydrolase family protein [Mucilaginibacter lappiensis]|uniref:SGNH hydrolase-type esterase domain-containing protein n=1 Tax=Mucilaginibacter lappiensis TaxID=354630 RepID=A0ABR6PIV1_9SPHI|nr:SGNH/GDSL hydrolase family protein [Mucilaginibacter lappiensis]MBB6109706.1 hypothetical protein [Mucilaginibacter lappiensis]SIR12575.1 GDSL-like Lipase/Acylhydrolase family protein [Mucilaginibacter lappiensis]